MSGTASVDTDPSNGVSAASGSVDGDVITVEAVDADQYGSELGPEEIVRRHLESGETSGYAYIDGGLSFGFPRLGLTDAQRDTFLEGLAPAIARVYTSITSSP
jgi:hypothetical protein